MLNISTDKGRRVTKWEWFLSIVVIVLVIGMILQNINNRQTLKLIQVLEEKLDSCQVIVDDYTRDSLR